MKKVLIGMVIVACLLVPGVSRAVELSPSCGYMFEGTTGFQILATNLFGLLGALGVGGMPADWTSADVETPVPGGSMTGDGVPDSMQVAVVAAVLCSGESTILSKFNANKAGYTAFLGNINTLSGMISTTPDTLMDKMTLAATDLTTWGTNHTPALTPTQLTLVADLNNLNSDISGVADISSVLPLLDPYANLFAVLAGLDSGEQNTINDLLGDLLGSMADWRTRLLAQAADLTALAAHPQIGAIAADLTAAATQMNTIAAYLNTFSLPAWQVLDRANPANEDFAALGDYNNDGKTNLDVWNAVKAMPGAQALYVKWTTSAEPFLGFPVVGALGLALMAGACLLGGAVSMRKK